MCCRKLCFSTYFWTLAIILISGDECTLSCRSLQLAARLKTSSTPPHTHQQHIAKMLARILLLLAVIEVAPLIKAHEKRSASVVFGSNCKIQNKALPSEYLHLMPQEKGGLAASVALNGSPLNAKWSITQLTLESNSFFEISNRQFETFLKNYYYQEMWMVSGSSRNHATSGKRDTLWVIEPAQVNTPVTIKHAVTGSYLTVPRGTFAQRNVILSSSASGDESKWEIVC